MQPGKYAIAKLEMKGKDPNHWYQQTDTYGSWRDMRKPGWRNKFLEENEEGAKLPKELRGEPKAQYCPKDTIDWLLIGIRHVHVHGGQMGS